jgi:hypothetical protein
MEARKKSAAAEANTSEEADGIEAPEKPLQAGITLGILT